MLSWLLRYVVGKIAGLPVRRRLNAFRQATHRPQEVQEALLQGILERHRHTDFGKRHRFADIRTLADFRRHLPIATYEYFAPYMERVAKGDFNALLADRQVHMFAMTSGTTAARKYIPVTDSYLADYRRGWNMWGLKTYRDHPEIRMRPIVQMSGDWEEFTTEAGIPCGSVSGLTAAQQLAIVRFIYLVPGCVGRITNTADKYYLALRLSLPRHPGLIIAANPSTLVSLARAGDKHKEALIRDLHDGTLSPHCAISADLRTCLDRAIRKKHPQRARELEDVVCRTGTLYPKDYWPKDLVIGNWMGGSVGAYLRHFPRYYGATPVRDIGLLASEGRMTIPIADGTPSGVLDVTTHYFEFIPEGEIDATNPTVLGAHELAEGKSYYIIPTTAYGLYRYHISDLVRVTGFYGRTPLVEFLGKGHRFANLTGEKLSEYQVTRAFDAVAARLHQAVTAYTVAPVWDESQPYYGLFLEEPDAADEARLRNFLREVDHQLGVENVEYAAKRESGRLGPIRAIVILAGAWSAWDHARLAQTGGSPEQYKHPCLIGDVKFRESMRVVREVAA
jgi:hypothetical protein